MVRSWTNVLLLAVPAAPAQQLLPRALDGAALPGGAALAPLAWANPACIARDGTMAFVAGIGGSARNQGVFVADAAGVRAIAVGCGGGGGSGAPGACGDPAPGGGTFAGFFQGTAFAPAIGDGGDVLFLADLHGAGSPRALFLWQAASASIARVAGVGDASPLGGTFAAVGPGVVAGEGEVAFLARAPARSDADVFWWRGGSLQRLAAVGDAVPGGAIAALATESVQFVDGTSVPIGALPAVDGCGGVALWARTGGRGGILVRRDGVDAWHVRTGDATPIGGTYLAIEAPLCNGDGAVAFFADVSLGAVSTSGWFVGRPGDWRCALRFFDPVDGGQCLGLAVSRGPMRALDDDGGLVLWCDLALHGGQDRIVRSGADGTVEVLARRGDATPFGVLGALNAWPACSGAGHFTVSAALSSGTARNGHFAAWQCAPRVAASPCARPGGIVRVDAAGPEGGVFMLAVSTVACDVALPPFGTLRIGPTPLHVLLSLVPYPADGPQAAAWSLPNDAALVGTSLHFQALTVDAVGAALGNRASTRVR